MVMVVGDLTLEGSDVEQDTSLLISPGRHGYNTIHTILLIAPTPPDDRPQCNNRPPSPHQPWIIFVNPMNLPVTIFSLRRALFQQIFTHNGSKWSRYKIIIQFEK